MLPSSHNGLSPFFFNTNLWGKPSYTSWHTPFEAVFPHTDKYILLRSITDDDIETVKAMLDKGFNPNSKIEKRYSPLTLASSLGRLAIIDYLIARGADVNFKDP